MSENKRVLPGVGMRPPQVKIIIVGGGFGGVYAARRLSMRLRGEASITLIDQHDGMLYTPMLAEAVGRSISLENAEVSYGDLFRGVQHLRAQVETVDLKARTVGIVKGGNLYADHLVLALGSVTNFHGVPGAEAHSFTLKSLEDARRVQRQASENVRMAAVASSETLKQQLLRVVIAGGGYTGIETAAAINDLMRDEAEGLGLSRDLIQVEVVESRERILAELPPELALYGAKILTRDGISVRTQTQVVAVPDGNTVVLNDGHQVKHSLLIWNAGVQPNLLVANSVGPKGKHHGLLTDGSFRVCDLEGVWALGDCAETPEPRDPGVTFAPTAQNAVREGVALADNIVQTLRRRNVRAFRYKEIGSLAVISRRRGVANVFGIDVVGIPAWLLWRAVYIAKMPSMRKRMAIIRDYVRLAFGRQHVPPA